ncbi:hypothetical protein [Nocardia sp. NPDC004722]
MGGTGAGYPPDAPEPRRHRWTVAALIAAVIALIIGSAAYSAHPFGNPGPGSHPASTAHDAPGRGGIPTGS